jgi:hypothetical protein
LAVGVWRSIGISRLAFFVWRLHAARDLGLIILARVRIGLVLRSNGFVQARC